MTVRTPPIRNSQFAIRNSQFAIVDEIGNSFIQRTQQLISIIKNKLAHILLIFRASEFMRGEENCELRIANCKLV